MQTLKYLPSSLRAMLAAASAALALTAASAHAAVLEWSFSGTISAGSASGPDAGTASGVFRYDTDTGQIHDVRIATPPGSPSGGLIFDAHLGESFYTSFGGLTFGQSGADPSAEQTAFMLAGLWLADLGAPGSKPISERAFAEFRCPSRSECAQGVGSSITNWRGGEATGRVVAVSAIPVPAGLPLLATGLVLLGWTARRKASIAP